MNIFHIDEHYLLNFSSLSDEKLWLLLVTMYAISIYRSLLGGPQ
jgi:hypothetical protein